MIAGMGGDGSATFRAGAAAYDLLVGRYSPALASAFVDVVGIGGDGSGASRVLDIGCGPGALTAELARRLGPGAVAAVDPSPAFVAACRERNPGVDVREARAERLPFPDGCVDAALAQLVLHFVPEPLAAAAEMRRILRPGGVAAACVWDFHDGMRLLRAFWTAARVLDPAAPDEAETMRFGRDGELAELLVEAGFADVARGALEVEVEYRDADELWVGFLAGAGPAGAYVAAQDGERAAALRDGLLAELGRPSGPFRLGARAWYASGRR